MTPGTNLTFFEHPAAPAARPGQRSLSETALRVGSVADLDWWAGRLAAHGLSVEGEVERFGDPPCVARQVRRQFDDGWDAYR
jgi:glyoxalase family protein